MIDFMQSGQVGDFTDPPAPFRRTSSGVVELRRGGGKIALFGAPFFLAGVFMLSGAAGIIPAYTESGERATPVILGPMGFVFLAIGGVMVFGRQWLILDLGRGSVRRQIGLLVPLRTSERPFSEFNAVVMTYDPGGSESVESYPVKLRGFAAKDVKIIDPLRFDESLRMAEYLAKTLHLPLLDSTRGPETTVNPDHVGESLRDRLSRAPETAPAERPVAMRSEVVRSAGETRIAIPAGGLKGIGDIRVLLPLAVFLFAMLIAIPTVGKSANPRTLLVILLLIFGVPSIFASVHFMITGKRRKTAVKASRSGLVIHRLEGRKTKTTVIPIHDVLDVGFSTSDSAIRSARRSGYRAPEQILEHEPAIAALRKLVPNPGIVVKSRSALITFGEGLSTDELQYLAWLLRKALAG
jgi:hypothetical protein